MSTSFDTGNEVTIVGTKFAHDLFPDQELPTDGREVRSLRGNLIRTKGPNIMTAEICNLVLKHPFHTHTHTHPFNGPLSGTTWVGQYQKGKTNLDFIEARDSEWQWHQLGDMQVCTSLQADNHASTPQPSFLQAGCPSCRPTNSVKALKAPVLILQ